MAPHEEPTVDALYSTAVHDRVLHEPIADQISKVKEAYFLEFFDIFRNYFHVAPEPYAEQFDKYWQIHVFEYCEDLDEAIRDDATKVRLIP
jgi:hypothetical protein